MADTPGMDDTEALELSEQGGPGGRETLAQRAQRLSQQRATETLSQRAARLAAAAAPPTPVAPITPIPELQLENQPSPFSLTPAAPPPKPVDNVMTRAAGTMPATPMKVRTIATPSNPTPHPVPIATAQPDGVYEKNGHPVVDTARPDAQGHVPTHRLDQPTNRQPGESFPSYEDRVLARRSFTPDTARTSNLAALEPEVQQSAQAMMEAAKRDGITLTPAETRRTQERQEMLFQKGRGRPGNPVTWTLTSDHTPGRAIDFNGDDRTHAWLQANASKFGFSTLGDMDPGHVSMPAPSTGAPGSFAAENAKSFAQLTPPVAAPIDQARGTPAPRNPQALQLSGVPKFASDVFAAMASQFENPAAAIASNATMIPKAGLKLARFTAEQDAANTLAANGGDPSLVERTVTPKEAAIATAQLATVLAAPEIHSLVSGLVTKAGLPYLIGHRAAGVLAGAVAGAPAGAAFNPEHPGVGAVLGAAAGGAVSSALGDKLYSKHTLARDVELMKERILGKPTPQGAPIAPPVQSKWAEIVANLRSVKDEPAVKADPAADMKQERVREASVVKAGVDLGYTEAQKRAEWANWVHENAHLPPVEFLAAEQRFLGKTKAPAPAPTPARAPTSTEPVRSFRLRGPARPAAPVDVAPEATATPSAAEPAAAPAPQTPSAPPPTRIEQAVVESHIRKRAQFFGHDEDAAVQLYRDELAGKAPSAAPSAQPPAPSAAAPGEPREYVPETGGMHATEEQLVVRNIARGLKTANPDAIAHAAPEMAARIPDNAILVPIPDHTGSTRANTSLAIAIAHIKGDAHVSEAVGRTAPTLSSRDLRQKGKPGLTADEHEASMEATAKLDANRPVVLIDNVETTGATGEGARRVLGRPDAQLVTYAKAPIPVADRAANADRPKGETLAQRAERLVQEKQAAAPAPSDEEARTEEATAAAPAETPRAQPTTRYNPEGRMGMVTPSARTPGKFQGTMFHEPDGTRPYGHFEADTPEAALAKLKEEGFDLPEKPDVEKLEPARRKEYEAAAAQLAELEDIRKNGDEWTPEHEEERQNVLADMRDILTRKSGYDAHSTPSLKSIRRALVEHPNQTGVPARLAEIDRILEERADARQLSAKRPLDDQLIDRGLKVMLSDSPRFGALKKSGATDAEIHAALAASWEGGPHHSSPGEHGMQGNGGAKPSFVMGTTPHAPKLGGKGNKVLSGDALVKRVRAVLGIPTPSGDERSTISTSSDVKKYDTPKIVEARTYNAENPETYSIDTPERDALRNRIAADEYGDGAATKGKEVTFFLGLPGAGKSTIAERYARAHGALLTDADHIKAQLPEYAGGKGSFVVHRESTLIRDMVRDRAIAAGDNVVIQTLGIFPDALKQMIADYAAKGWKVHLKLADLPAEKAAERAVARYENGGHFVDPEYILSIGDGPRRTFDALKSHPGVTTYERYDSDVAKGESPRLVERGEGTAGEAAAERSGVDVAGGGSGRGTRVGRKPSGSAQTVPGHAGTVDVRAADAPDTGAGRQVRPSLPGQPAGESPRGVLRVGSERRAPVDGAAGGRAGARPVPESGEAAGGAAPGAGEGDVRAAGPASERVGGTGARTGDGGDTGAQSGRAGRLRVGPVQPNEPAAPESVAAPVAGRIKPDVAKLLHGESESLEVEGEAAPGQTDEDIADRESAEPTGPINAFHGTQGVFDELQPSKSGQFGPAVYLTDSTEEANKYATATSTVGNAPNVRPVIVEFKKPLVLQATNLDKPPREWFPTFGPQTKANVEHWQSLGYDGVIARQPTIEGVRADGSIILGAETTHYVAFDAKSVRPRFSSVAPEVAAHTPAEIKAVVDRQPAADNHVIEGDLGLTSGVVARAKDNLTAIKLLKELEAAKRTPTEGERAILAKYVGWGGVAGYLDTGHKLYESPLGQEIRAALTDEEFRAAAASTPNAHYTSVDVARAMHDLLGQLGFHAGKNQTILEPSMGAGVFIGTTPAKQARAYRWTGVELDSITGRIGAMLYPKADVRVQGFEKVKVPDGYFDAAVGNVPFGDYQLADPRYDKLGLSIHDYFFAKTLDLVRPGGVIAYITSRYTLDKQSSTFRKYLAERADLLGAIRLPNTAFKGNAGTDVVTDLIVLQRRPEGAARAGEPFEKLVDIDTPEGKAKVNEYFAGRSFMMLGEPSLAGTMYGKNEFTLTPNDRTSLAEQLAFAVRQLPKGVYEPRKIETPATRGPAELPTTEKRLAPDNLQDGAFVIEDGKLRQNRGGVLEDPKVPSTQLAKVTALTAIKEAAKALLRAETDNAPEPQLDALRKRVNQLYDRFVKDAGPINTEQRVETKRRDADGDPIVQVKYPNLSAFSDDPEYHWVTMLERYDPESGKAAKGDILTRRLMEPRRSPERVDTPSQALAVSLAETGKIDVERMAQLAGTTPEQVVDALGGTAMYQSPASGEWELADHYLSGDVKAKLAHAKEAALKDPRYQPNVEALEKAIPADIPPSQIGVRLGAPWIPTTDIQRFIAETLGLQPSEARQVTVSYLPFDSSWKLSVPNYVRGKFEVQQTWGTVRADAFDLIGDSLNSKPTEVTDPHPTEEGKRVKNIEATFAAQEKQQALQDRFRQWLWEDGDRALRLSRLYNDKFNRIRLPNPDGSHMTFPGTAAHVMGHADFQLRPHQKNAVWRILTEGNTLLAHVVGSGKTFTMVAAGMEAKRLGLARKPLYTVPNHMLAQFRDEFKALYPMAKLLVATKDDFAGDARREFVGRAAANDWDAIIMTHRSFESVPMSREFQEEYINRQVDELEDAIREAKASRAERALIKQIEKAKKRLEAKLERLMAQDKKDQFLSFEQMGVDMLFADEAHSFKNLAFTTQMKGIAVPSSEKAFDFYLKTQYLHKTNPGRGVVLATGTPISNALAELYTIQRYLQPEALADRGIGAFDAWAATFADPVTKLELAPDGSGARMSTRLAKYNNLGELAQMFRLVTDVQNADDLKLPRPELKGGKMEVVSAPATPALKAHVQSLVRRAKLVKEKKVDPEEDNFLAITNSGRHAAMDMRLVDAGATDDPHSKINLAVQKIADIYKRTTKLKGAQLVFSDLSAPGSSPVKMGGVPDFNIYDAVRGKLIAAGVPSKEIRFIHDADTDAKKKKLFDDVRAGRVRILIGSTPKMGAGTNVQDRLVALHHLDAPWRPSDVEQRNGRILRQGNQLYNTGKIPHVEVYAYVTEGSFDAYIWQTLERKADFIQQAMKAGPGMRSLDDEGDVEIDFATAKAIASGNPKVMEKAQVDSDVARLERLERAHQDQMIAVRREIAELPAQIKELEPRARDTAADIKKLTDTAGDKFTVTIGGSTVTKRTEAGEMLRAAVTKADISSQKDKGNEITNRLGTFAGLELFAIARTSLVTGKTESWLALKGADAHFKELQGNESAASLLSQLEHLPDKIRSDGEKFTAALDRANTKLAALKESGVKPFEHADKLKALKVRQDALGKELQADAERAEKEASETPAEKEAKLRTALSGPNGEGGPAVGSPVELNSFTDPVTAALKMWKDANALRDARLSMEQVRAAAVKLPSGKIVEAPTHIQALEKARAEGLVPKSWMPNYDFDDGWATTRRPFVSREVGYRVAEKAEQLKAGAKSRSVRELTHDNVDLYGFADPFTAAYRMLQQANALKRARSAQSAGIRYVNPPAPPVLKRVAELSRETRDSIYAILVPAAITDDAAQAGRVKNARLGEKALNDERAREALLEAHATLQRMPVQERYDFVDRFEHGQPQPTPFLSSLDAAIRAVMDDRTAALKALGKGHLKTFRKNYWGRILVDPKTAASGKVTPQQQAFRDTMTRRPLQGRATFKKKRTFEYLSDALAAGYEPITKNPVDWLLLKIREMNRYIAAHEIKNELRAEGLVKFLRPSKPLPEGYEWLDDRIFTAYASRGTQGEMRIRGKYAAPIPVARIVNNYLAPGLRGNPLYDGYMFLGNTMNMLQLGFSAFHLGFVSFDATISQAALGIEQLSTPGQRLRGLGNVAVGSASMALAPLTGIPVLSPALMLAKGARLRNAYLHGTSDVHMERLVEAVAQGGGRVKMDDLYKSDAVQKMKSAFADKRWVGTALQVPFAAVEASMKPILEFIVPRLKMGAFYTLAEHELSKLPTGATEDDVRRVLQAAWSTIDDRLGQVVYDNYHWHNVTKHALMGGVRAVGWNRGSISLTIGGAAEVLGTPIRAWRKTGALGGGGGRGGGGKGGGWLGSGATGGDPNGEPEIFSHKLAYVVAAAALMALYGAIYTYLHSGDRPGYHDGKFQGAAFLAKDLYVPRTGTVNRDHSLERITPATYIKDVIGFSKHPIDTVVHKMQPALSLLSELIFTNKNYFGDDIRNTEDPVLTQARQVAEEVLKSYQPIAVSNAQEATKRGAGARERVENFVGNAPASRELVRSPAQNLMLKYLGSRTGGLTPEARDQANERADLRRDLQSGEKTKADVRKLVVAGELTPRQGANIASVTRRDPRLLQFEKLTPEQAVKVYELGNSEEQQLWERIYKARKRQVDRLSQRRLKFGKE